MKITFLLHPSVVNTASTQLRGVQLAELLCGHPATSVRDPTTTCDPSAISDSFVYVTKGALRQFDLDVLSQLRQRRNILVADPVDDTLRPDAVSLVDGLVASSLRQAREMRRAYPDVPVHHVTHNVDRRIPSIVPQQDDLRIAYVGESINARYRDRIDAYLDILHTDTSTAHTSWIDRLKRYNCHYAVRQRQSWDGHKPFTKGFIAAHCRCPIITERTEGDALEYLSEEYPYYVDGTTFNSLRDGLAHIAYSFGSSEWRFALQIMDSVRTKSSRNHVLHELTKMIDSYK